VLVCVVWNSHIWTYSNFGGGISETLGGGDDEGARSNRVTLFVPLRTAFPGSSGSSSSSPDLRRSSKYINLCSSLALQRVDLPTLSLLLLEDAKTVPSKNESSSSSTFVRARFVDFDVAFTLVLVAAPLLSQGSFRMVQGDRYQAQRQVSCIV
jgi:hypothetical protein